VAGQVGSQRIWGLVCEEIEHHPPAEALANVVQQLEDHSREVVACNVGLMDRQRIYVACRYTTRADYYQLRWHASESLRMICSEPLPGYAFYDVPANRVFEL
jgi:predicted glutamine amidotransferase